MYTVYSYWNFQSIVEVLNFIVLVMGGGDYLGLVRTIAIAGLLVAVGVGLAKISAKEPLQYFIFLMLFYSMLFVPKVTVTVQDLRSGNTGTVANVPLGVGFFYSATSRIGKYLTETFETAFVASDALKFSNTGMAFGARAFTEMTAVRIKDPKLTDGMTEFVRACVNPEVLDDATRYNQLLNAPDLWSTIGSSGWLNPGRSVNLPRMSGVGYDILPCIGGSGSDAYGVLTAALATEVDSQQGWLGRALNPEMTAAAAKSAVATQLPDVEAYMLGTSRSVVEQIRQGIMVNLLQDSSGSLAVVRNDPAAVQVAIAGRLAESQATSSYRTMTVIGEAALPKFRNIVEVVVIAVFPVVFLLVILGGEKGGVVLKSYVMTSVWVQLWAPVYAIVNFMMQPGTAQRLQAALDAAASPTMLNTLGLSQTGFKEASIAGALVFAVPVIAYALVKGGEVAMNGAMTGLTGPAKGAAESAGAAAGSGSFSMGNTSWGTHTANNMAGNKWDDNGSSSTGAWSSRRGDFGYSADLGAAGGGSGSAGVYGDASNRVANMGAFSAALTASVGEMAQSQISSLRSKGTEASTAYSNAVGAAFDSYKDNQRNSGGSVAVGASANYGTSGSGNLSFSSAVNSSTAWADGLGLSKQQAFQLTASATAGLQGFLASAGAMGLSGQKVESSFSAAQQASKSAAFQEAFGTVMSGASGADTRSSATSGNATTAGEKSSATSVQSLAESARSSFSRADSIQSSLAAFKQGGTQTGMNLANILQQQNGGAGALEQLTRPGQEGAMMAAIQKTAESVLHGEVGGYFAPSSGGTPLVKDMAASPIGDQVDTAVGNAAGKAKGGAATVAVAQKGNARRLAGPSSSVSLTAANGTTVTPASVTAEASGRQVGMQAAVDAGKTDAGRRANETGVKAGGAAGAASKPGALLNQTIGEAASGLGGELEAVSGAIARAVAGNSIGSWTREGPAATIDEGKVTTPETANRQRGRSRSGGGAASQIPADESMKAPPPKWQ